MEWYDWFFDCIRNKYMKFDGRARRKEYWFYTLDYIILAFVASILGQIPFVGIIVGVVWTLIILALILPSLAVTVRRLHDTGRSGWWVILGFIPIACFVLLYFLIQDSQSGSNQYGENPKN